MQLIQKMSTMMIAEFESHILGFYSN